MRLKVGKILMFVGLLCLIGAAVYIFINWQSIPDSVPMHYNLGGMVDRYGSKGTIIVPVAIGIALYVFLFAAMRHADKEDPANPEDESSGRGSGPSATMLTELYTFIAIMLAGQAMMHAEGIVPPRWFNLFFLFGATAIAAVGLFSPDNRRK